MGVGVGCTVVQVVFFFKADLGRVYALDLKRGGGKREHSASERPLLLRRDGCVVNEGKSLNRVSHVSISIARTATKPVSQLARDKARW